MAAPYDRPHPPDHHYSQLRSIPIPVILTAQILTSPAIPTPSRFTSPKTQQQLSRPARRHRLHHRDPRGAVCRRAHRRLRHPVLHLSTCDTTSLWSSLGWLPRLTQQTLVITGTADALVPAANASILACRMPRAQIHRVHGGGHLCLLDRAAEVGPIVSAFLRSLERTAINEVAELG